MKKILQMLTFVLLFLFSCPLINAVTDSDIQNGNILWYNLINNTGNLSGTTVIDKSGRNNGTLSAVSCNPSYPYCNFTTGSTITLSSALNLTPNSTQYVIMKSSANNSDRYLLTGDNSGNFFSLGQFPANNKLASYMGGAASTYSQSTLSDTAGSNRIIVLQQGTSYWYFNNGTNVSDSAHSLASDTNYLWVTKVGSGTKTQPGSYFIVAIWNRTLNQSEIDYLQTQDNWYSPYASGGGGGGGTSPHIEFESQSPSDITDLNLIATKLNITYNVTNDTGLSRTYLNYSYTGNGCVFAVNKTCQLEYGVATTLANSSSATTHQSFIFDDNDIYPATYNINQSLLEQTSNQFTTLTSTNQYILTTINNVSIKRYGIFEIMANTTGNSDLYYCNSSFDFSNPVTSGYCVQFATLNQTGFNHTHEGGFSKHNFFSFPINTTSGKLGNLSVTSTSYFLIRGSSTGSTYVYNVVLTSGAYYYKNTTNSGSSWSNMSSVTIDAHLHQYNGTEVFNYQGCVNKSGTVTCASVRTDNLDVTVTPPTAPGITNPSTDGQNGTNYFNLTWLPSIPFNTSYTIQGYNVSLLNNDSSFNQTLIGNTTNTSYYFDLYNLNLSIGSYKFKVVATSSSGLTSFAISRYINLYNNAVLNVSVRYGLDNSTLGNYTLNVTDTVTGITVSYQSNTTTNKTYLEIVRGRNYNFTIDAVGYAIQNFSGYNWNNTYNNITFSIYTSNSVLITIYDESSLVILNTTTVSVTFTNNATANIYTTTNGTMYKSGLTDGTWEVKFYATNYSYRTYTITVNNRSFQTLDAYLVPSTYLCTFTVRNSVTLASLQDVSFTVQRLSNGSYITVESRYTDISGNVQIGFLPGLEYRFTLTKTGYSSKVFSLDPIIFNSYNVYLDPTSTLNNTFDYGLISVVYYPKTFYNGVLNNLTFVISSPEGVLSNYAVTIKGKGTNGQDSDSGTNAYGETFNLQFNISNASIFDRVNLTFNYTSTVGGFKSYRFEYGIIGASGLGNNTIANIKNNNYGLGMFESVLVVMIALAIITGFAYMLTGLGGALVIGLLVLNVSVFLGFLPLWSIIITDILAIVLLVAVSIGGRN